MHLFKKIKIEIWVLYLIVWISLLLAIANGILVRQELAGSVKLGVISKAALFLAEIPQNLKEMATQSKKLEVLDQQRFTDLKGFQGKANDEEQYLLLSKYDGDKNRSIVELIDLRNFEVKKTWSPDIDLINSLVDVSRDEFKDHLRDKNSSRYLITHPFLTEDGGLIFKSHSPLVKIDKNSELVWQNQEDAFHHSIEQDHEGNFWVPTYSFPYRVDEKYVGLEWGNFYDDSLTKISGNGEILFHKSVSNIFIENNMKYLLFPIVDSFMNDPIHLNDIQPVLTDGPYWKQGDLFLSLRNQSMIVLYRPTSNKIIWKGVGRIYGQHDVDILDDHRISIFNNNVYADINGNKVDGNNEVVIYDFKTDSYSKYFNESLLKYNVKTITNGLSQIMPDGSLFIEEQNYGRLLYFNKDTSLQWQYVNRADDGKVYYLRWARILHKPEDIKKVNKII